MITGFKDPTIAEKLKKQAQLHEPKFKISLGIPEITLGDLRCYVVEVKDQGITAAQDPLAIGSIVGKGTAWLAQRNKQTDILEYWFPSAGNKVEVEVFNLTAQSFQAGDILLVVQDRDGDLWAIPFANTEDLAIVEPLSCFQPNSVDQQAYLYLLVDCLWTKTQETVLLNDPLDANMLLPNEKVFAKKREGCEDQQGKGRYDIVGSHGLTRLGYATSNILCGDKGNILLIESVAPRPNQQGQLETVCDTGNTQCTIEACNGIPVNRCIKQNEKTRIQYHKRGLWDILPFPRNSTYFATADTDVCGDPGEIITFTDPEPLDYCMDATELQDITTAINRLGLPWEEGDQLYLKENLTTCDGDRYVINVSHKCVEVARADCDDDGKFLEEGQCQILGKVQRTAIMYCQPPQQKLQIQLIDYEAIDDMNLGGEDCGISLDGSTIKFCAFAGVGQGTISDYGSFGFETVNAIVDPVLDIEFDEDPSQESGASGEGCVNGKLYIKGTTYPVIKCGPGTPYQAGIGVDTQDFVADVTQDAEGCPVITHASALVLKANCETWDDPLDCDDCVEVSGQ